MRKTHLVKLLSSKRLRQVAVVGGIETFGVVLSGIAGLLIVNVLPKDQYAAYTFLVACSMLIIGITDLGLAHCCFPVIGQRAAEVDWVVAACRHVFHKRWILLSAGLAIIGPYWFLTSSEHRWFEKGYWLASTMVLAVALIQLKEHYCNTVLLILTRISTLNRVAATSHLVRLSLVGLVLLMPTNAYSVAGLIGAGLVASLLTLALYKRAFVALSIGDRRLGKEDARKVNAHIIRIAKPLVLPAIFYQLQGVITIFVVSIFGTSTMIAEVGAFGRLAMALVIVDRVANVLLFPAVARAQTGPKFVRVLVQIHSLYLLSMVLTFLTSVLFPQYWILLLGEQYRSMTPLVWMMFLAALLANGTGFAFRTLAVRGATSHQSFGVIATLATQLLYLWLIGITDLKSVLGFGLATSLANFLFQYGLLLTRWNEWRKVGSINTSLPVASAPLLQTAPK